jgi:hypothetical protein
MEAVQAIGNDFNNYVFVVCLWQKSWFTFVICEKVFDCCLLMSRGIFAAFVVPLIC